MLNRTFIYTAGLAVSISVLNKYHESRKDRAITKIHTSKYNSSKMEPNKNTCLPEWTGIPKQVQQYILEFLTPSIALKNMITLSKNNLDLHSEYIIHRLENFKCKFIQLGDKNNFVLYQDGPLYAWGENDHGRLGLGHDEHQNTPQLPTTLKKSSRWKLNNIMLTLFR